MEKSMLHENELPKTFWVEADYMAIYLINKCPTCFFIYNEKKVIGGEGGIPSNFRKSCQSASQLDPSCIDCLVEPTTAAKATRTRDL